MLTSSSKINLLGVCAFFVLGIVFSGYGQDSLIYRNGSRFAVEIITVSQKAQILEYKLEDKSRIVSLELIERYKFKDKWVELSVAENTAVYPVELKDRMLDRSFLDVRSNWSVGTNISSLLNPEGQGLNQSIRRMLTIEPEYRLNNELLSIKGTFDIGLPFPAVRVYPDFKEINYSPYNVNNGVVTYYSYSNTISSADINPLLRRPYYTDRYIPFQTGLSFKFWPSKQLRERFFLHLGFVTGIADYHAVTVFDSFESTQDEWGSTYLQYVSSIAEVEQNEFFFFRPEVGLGYNFLLNKHFSFNIDLAITDNPKNRGVLPDIVYVRIDNQEYEKLYERVFEEPSYLNRFSIANNFLLRFKLIFHFTKS